MTPMTLYWRQGILPFGQAARAEEARRPRGLLHALYLGSNAVI